MLPRTPPRAALAAMLAAAGSAHAQQWVDLNIPGPSARWQTGVAYAANRQVVVLFGGLNAAGQRLNDTWEFDGSAWTPRAPTTPPQASSGHALLYAPTTAQVWLVGGETATGITTSVAYVLNNAGTAWSVAGFVFPPGPRLQPAAVWDASPTRNSGLLSGGLNGASRLTDTWALTSGWSLRSSSGAGARQGHVAFYDSAIGFPVFYGGLAAASPFQTAIWTGNGYEFGPSTPGPRYLAAAAFDAARAKGLMFGGNTTPWTTTTPVSTETWEWTGSQGPGAPSGSWTRVATVGPAESQGAVMFYHPPTGKVYLFGGADAGAASVSGRTYVWSTAPACYANCDASTTTPLLNALDFACFLTRYRAGETYANCDGSTTTPALNALDFACFLQRYQAGCP